MRTNNNQLITIVIILFVIVFLVGPFIGLVRQFLLIPPVTVATAVIGAVWFISAAIAPFRGGNSRNVLGSSKVTYWRGQKIVTRQPSRARLRPTSGTQTAGALWYLALGLGSAYAAVITLLQLLNIV